MSQWIDTIHNLRRHTLQQINVKLNNGNVPISISCRMRQCEIELKFYWLIYCVPFVILIQHINLKLYECQMCNLNAVDSRLEFPVASDKLINFWNIRESFESTNSECESHRKESIHTTCGIVANKIRFLWLIKDNTFIDLV